MHAAVHSNANEDANKPLRAGFSSFVIDTVYLDLGERLDGLAILTTRTTADTHGVELGFDGESIVVIWQQYGAAMGFTLPARFELDQATLSGRVELRCVDDGAVEFLVESERVRTNPDGRYQATVTMAGIVRVTVVVDGGELEERRVLPSPVELVELTGAGRYEVPTLVVDRCAE